MMVDVNIAREEVEVDRARVVVVRQALEYRQTYSEAALKFEQIGRASCRERVFS